VTTVCPVTEIPTETQISAVTGRFDLSRNSPAAEAWSHAWREKTATTMMTELVICEKHWLCCYSPEHLMAEMRKVEVPYCSWAETVWQYQTILS